jgi:hypothetical protein
MWAVKKYHRRFTLFKVGLRGIFALPFDLGFDGALLLIFNLDLINMNKVY